MARGEFLWKLVGLIGVVAWLGVVIAINLWLAHFREVASLSLFDSGNDVLGRILANRGAKRNGKLDAILIGALFATITLVDVITFSDIFQDILSQQKWDAEQEEYKAEFEALLEELDETKEDYSDKLKEIGGF